MMIDVAAFMETLPIMGFGMAGIFVVMLVILGTIKLLGIAFREK